MTTTEPVPDGPPPPTAPPPPRPPGSAPRLAAKRMTMGRLARRNVRSKPGRFIATMLAVIVGTAFLSGALVLRDSLSSSLESNAKKQVLTVDAALQPKPIESSGPQAPDQQPSGVPFAELATVQGLQHVAGAAGISAGQVEILTSNRTPARAGSIGRLWIPVDQLNPFQVMSGSAPANAGEIAIDQGSAEALNLGVGSQVQLRTTSGQQSARIVGVTTFGDEQAANASGDIFVSQADAATYLSGGVQQYDAVYVAAAPGQQSQMLTSLRQAAGANYAVLDNAQLQEQEAGAAGGFATTIGVGLQIFAYVALFVCLFIVYNTFSIIVAQRLREFALLRAIGADTRQIRKSVRREALLVGLLASFAGLLAGIGLFQLLLHFVPAFQSLASGGAVRLRVGPWSAVLVMVLGLAITFVSAVVPSFRAGRTKPIQALQEVAIDRSGVNRFRAIAGPVLLVAGAGLLVLGVSTGQFLIGVLGPFLLFLGVMVGGPRLAVWFTAAAGFLVRPFARRVGKLAVENVRRNPSRTATTANALVIGVFLVVFVTAAGGALRDYFAVQVSQFAGPDLTVVVERGELPAQLPQQIAAIPGVTGTAPIYPIVGKTELGAQGVAPVAATDFSKLEMLGFKASGGSLTGLSDDQVVVWSLLAQPVGLTVGSPVTLTFPNGQTQRATIGAVVDPVFTVPPVIMSKSAALANNPNLQPQQMGLQVEPGQTQAVQQRIEDMTVGYTSVQVLPGNIFGQLIKGFFTALIESVNALLGIAVVIALFGIVNTLILSVTERTREIGILRAVGMSRSQLRSTIRIEAMIVALLGTGIGIVFGLFVSYVLTRPIFEDGSSSFNWPVQEMVLIAALGVVLGVLASLVPAWRAGRLDVLDAVKTE